MQPRDYQRAALDGLASAVRHADSAYVSMATGTGKSIIFKSVAVGCSKKGGRSLLLVRGKDLVAQAAAHLRAAGLRVGIEMGRMRSDQADQAVVASIDTMVRRLHRFPADTFSVIQVDECHRSYCVSYLRVLAHFGMAVPKIEDGTIIDDALTERSQETRLIGYTATPDRGDKKDIELIFRKKAFEYTIQEACRDGWLVWPKVKHCAIEGLDLSAVRRTAGELNAVDLGDALRPVLRPIVEAIVDHAGGDPTLIYSPLVSIAEDMTDIFRSVDPARRIETITGETGQDQRKVWFEEFKRGDLCRFSSVATLIEGVDLPNASVIAMARPTSVRMVYAQIIGRALRPPPVIFGLETAEQRIQAIAESSKPYALVVDFTGNSGKHKLQRAVDLFGEDLPDFVRDMADGLLDEHGGDVQAAIAAALAEVKKMEEDMRGKPVNVTTMNPFELVGLEVQPKERFGRAATRNQLMAIVRCGIVPLPRGDNSVKALDDAMDRAAKYFDFNGAEKVLEELGGRRRADMATVRQIRLLVKKGMPHETALALRTSEASTAIDQIIAASSKTGAGAGPWAKRWADVVRARSGSGA